MSRDSNEGLCAYGNAECTDAHPCGACQCPHGMHYCKPDEPCEYCKDDDPCDYCAEPDPTDPEDAISGASYMRWLAVRRHERRMSRPEDS